MKEKCVRQSNSMEVRNFTQKLCPIYTLADKKLCPVCRSLRLALVASNVQNIVGVVCYWILKVELYF